MAFPDSKTPTLSTTNCGLLGLRASNSSYDMFCDADGAAAGPLHGPLMELVETTLVQQVVEATDGNRTAAARLLGVDRATLRAKLSR